MGDLTPISRAATLLFANGQTTERMVVDTERLAAALGHQVSIIVRWGELILRHTEADATIRNEIVVVSPTGVDMHKVAAATAVIEAERYPTGSHSAWVGACTSGGMPSDALL